MLRDFNTYDWFTISLIITGVGFIWLKQINHVKYLRFIKMLYSNSYFKEKLKESYFFSGFEVMAFLLANFIFVQACYVFLSLNADLNLIFSSHILSFGLIFILFSVLSFAKIYLEKLVNFCFADHQFLKVYVFYKQMIWSYATYLGLPLLIFYVYYPGRNYYLFLTGLGVVGVFYIINIIYFIIKNRQLVFRNWYYFILYLCTLEIAPYYFIYKLIATA